MAAVALSAPSRLHSRLQQPSGGSHSLRHNHQRLQHVHHRCRAPSQQHSRLHALSQGGDNILRGRSLRCSSAANVSGPERREQRALHAPNRSEAELEGGRCAHNEHDLSDVDNVCDGQRSDPVSDLPGRSAIDERGVGCEIAGGTGVVEQPKALSDMTLEGFLAAEGKTLSDYSCPICLEVYSEPDSVMPVTLDCCSNSLCLACCKAIVEILTSLRRKAGHLVNETLLGQSAVVLELVRLREEKEAEEAQRRADEEDRPKARRKEVSEHVRFAELAAHTPVAVVEAGPPGLNSSGSSQSRPKRKAESHSPRSLPPRAHTRSATVLSSPNSAVDNTAVSSRFQKPGREAPSTTNRKRTRAHSGAEVRISLHNLDGAGTYSDEDGDDDDDGGDNGGSVSYRDRAKDSCRRSVRKRARLHDPDQAPEGESPWPSTPRMSTGGIQVLLNFNAPPKAPPGVSGASTSGIADTQTNPSLDRRRRRAHSSRSIHRAGIAVDPSDDASAATREPPQLELRSRSHAPKVSAPAAMQLEAPHTPSGLPPPLRPRSRSGSHQRFATTAAGCGRRGWTTTRKEAEAIAAVPSKSSPRSPFLLLAPRELRTPGLGGNGRLVDITEGRWLRSGVPAAA
ncbi:hypothetical protein HK405_006693, partial [Cladochytrium tenue]